MRQGLGPAKLAQCVAIGLVIAVFPALGVTTLMAGLAAVMFRLNMLAIQTVNYLAYPLQFALILPFYSAGQRLFHEPQLLRPASEILALIRSAPLSALQELWTLTWHAAVVWAMLACLAIPLLILVLTPFFSRFAPEKKADPKGL